MAGPSLCQQQNGHGAATAIAQRELSPGLPEGLTSHNLYWTSSVSWPAAVCLSFLSFSLNLLFTLSWSLYQLLCGVQDSHFTPSFDIRSPSISRSLYFLPLPFLLVSSVCFIHQRWIVTVVFFNPAPGIRPAQTQVKWMASLSGFSRALWRADHSNQVFAARKHLPHIHGYFSRKKKKKKIFLCFGLLYTHK